MFILNIIFNTFLFLKKRSCINGVDSSERGYTLTMLQTKVRFSSDKILIFSVWHASCIITFNWGNLWKKFLILSYSL